MHRHTLCLLMCGVAISGSSFAQQEAAAVKAASEPVQQLPEAGKTLSIEACCGAVDGEVQVAFGAAGKGSVTLSVRCLDMPKLNHHWQLDKGEAELPDAALQLRLIGEHGWGRRAIVRTYFIRPDVHFYVDDDLKSAVAHWSELPPASAHRFRLELSRRRERVEIAIDGRYFSSLAVPSSAELRLSVKGGAELGKVGVSAGRESGRYLPVALTPNPHQGDTRFLSLSLAPGVQEVSGVPVDVAAVEAEVDVGLARWLRQKKGAAAYYDPYYRRTAWDGVPETIMFSVPRRFYNYVHVLCAVEDSSDESPSMSIRLARYRQVWDGGGATQADTTVTIDPADPRGCASLKKVGSVQTSSGGTARTLALYLAEIPLQTGELADYLRLAELTGNETPDFFYLEFTRELRTRVTSSYSYYEKKPLGPPSSVHIFGVTLETAPAEILVGSGVVGNVFATDERPLLRIEAGNPAAPELRLQMRSCLTDVDGTALTNEEELVLPAGSTTREFTLGHLRPGWYSARFSFTAAGRTVWEQPLCLALLPPDTRQAGAESPYGTWWFARSHYCEADADKVLPLVQKMGFRHVTPRDLNPTYGHTPEVFARYGVTPSMMRRLRERGKLPPVEEQAATFMGDWPDTRFAMIFHESRGPKFGLAPPPELLGQPPPQFTEEDLAKEKELLEHIERHAAAIHSAAPQAKIILGNSATNFNVHWLRRKLPRKYWDHIGMEMAVQMFHPEGQPHGWNLQGLWMAKRMCEIYGYEDVPITSCFEFDYRPTAPGALSLRQQADWYSRDVLHCLAYRLPTINVALLFDVDSAYYFSRWGSTGVCFRSPLLMPKPSFVALATLTRVLDQAQYQRWLDTGSHSLYCLEFSRDSRRVYALWASSGKRDVRVTVADGVSSCGLVDSMGRETELDVDNGTLRTVVSESPCYLMASAPLQRVEALQPHHHEPSLAAAAVVDRLQAVDWQIVAGGDEKFRDHCPYKPLTEAECSIGAGEDGSLELTLQSQPDVPGVVGQYVVLEPKHGPIAVSGTPNTIGAWVNGNSNWGRLVLQMEDAEGNVYTSISFGDWDVSDWRARTCINFDGWKFIGIGFPLEYASGHYGLEAHCWSRLAPPVYPVKVTRVYVIMREKQVYVTDMVQATSMSIGLRDLSVGTDPAKLGPSARHYRGPTVPRRYATWAREQSE